VVKKGNYYCSMLLVIIQFEYIQTIEVQLFYFTDTIVELCIICFNDETSVILRPCGHIFCNICALRFIQEDMHNCPLCNYGI